MGNSAGKPAEAAPHNGVWPDDHLSQYTEKKTYTSCDRTAVHSVIASEVGPASHKPLEEGGTPPLTIIDLLKVTVAKSGDKVALRVERGLPMPTKEDMKAKRCAPNTPLDSWKSWTWAEYDVDAQACAKGLIKYGVQRFDGVNIYGFNSPEWILGEVGAIYAGAIASGIYPSDKPEQVAFKSHHSAASAAIVEGEKHLNVFKQIIDEIPDMKVVVVWDENFPKDHPLIASGISRKDGSTVAVTHWDTLISDGKADAAAAAELETRVAAMQAGNVCAYIYTSGTTGQPKAVMMTHDNIIFESVSMDMAMDLLGKDGEERIISYLPLSHVAGMLCDIITPIAIGAIKTGWCSVSFARPYDLKMLKIVERIKIVRPTFFLGVPRVWEKFAEKMAEVGARIAAGGGLKPKISKWAKSVTLHNAKDSVVGGQGSTKFGHGIASKILGKARAGLGLDQMKYAMTGAAPIKVETLEYFGSIGIGINEVYGMSECAGACTFSSNNAHVWGSCGFAMPGQEVKIFTVGGSEMVECPRATDLKNVTEEQQGEICYRGRNVMAGYMANPKLGAEHVALIEKKNAAAIDQNGWLHSGDKGCMSVEGFVKITGRYKELIITAGGENVAPVPIEDAIKARCPAISNIMMVGDKRKFNSALITLKAFGTGLDPGGTDLEAASQAFDCTTIATATANADYIKMITDAIVATNNDGDVCPSSASKVQKFTILPIDLSVEGEELTATLKLKRSVVAKKYLKSIDSFYSADNLKNTFVPCLDSGVSSSEVKVADQ